MKRMDFRQFTALRQKLLATLAQGRTLADQSLGPLASQLDETFTGAQATIDHARLTWTIIGAEGQGKSTLINALTGQPLSPEEKQHPGTVAPVYLEWGPSPTPAYLVQLEGDAELRRCADVEAFKAYLLQRHNRDNAKHVLAGIVRVDHPILQQGLRLVDMPGLGGVSATVRQTAQTFLKAHTHAVLAVVRERQGYPAFIEIMQRFGLDGTRVQAVVLNWNSDDLSESSGSALRAWMTETKVAAAEYLQTADYKVPLERLFLLHLPSVYQARVHAQPRVTNPAHAEEAQHFNASVWEYVRTHGVAQVIFAGTVSAGKALGELKARLTIRQQVLGALTNTQTTGSLDRAKLTQEYKDAQKRTMTAWEKVSHADVVACFTEKHWQSTRHAVHEARDNLLAVSNTIRTEVDKVPEKVTKAQASQWHLRLQKQFDDGTQKQREAQESALQTILEYYCAHANAILQQFYKEVPLLAATIPANQLTITPEKLVQWQLGAMEPNKVAQFLKFAAVTGSAATAAGMAAGFGGHMALLTAFGLAAGPAGWLGLAAGFLLTAGAWKLVSDSHRSAVIKELERFRTDVQNVDTSDNGAMRTAWAQQVAAMVAAVGAYLTQDITHIGALVSVPEKHRDILLKELQQIDHTMARVAQLEDELDKIVAMAHED
jgi:hypothetical protein